MRAMALLAASALVAWPEVGRARAARGRRAASGLLAGPDADDAARTGQLRAASAAAGSVVRRHVPMLQPQDDPAVGAGLLLLLPALVVLPGLVLLLVPGTAIAVWVRRRAAAAAAAAHLRRSLPDTVDLLRLAVGGGATPRLALAAAARHGTGPVAESLLQLDRRLVAGGALGDELDHLGSRLGEPILTLVGVLRAAALDGAPLAPALDRLADELRADRRRHAEADARRLPVKLLFPLVCCALPALVLLSIVPLLVGTVRSMHL